MEPSQFQDSPAGRLLKIGRDGAAYWAFIPDPLPPQISFNAKLIRALSDADRALGELAGLGRTMSNPQLLIGPFLRREAVLSSRIEGTQADIADLYAYEAGQLTARGQSSEADVREVHNYVSAMRYGLERLESLPVSLRLLRELHEKLMEGVRGEYATPGKFRRYQNWIGRPGSSVQEADFVPPPVETAVGTVAGMPVELPGEQDITGMNRALEDLESYIHREDDYPPLMRLAFIHYQFEAIHPFVDGNGRIGRLLISLLLIDWKLLPLPLLYLSVFFERHRHDYYDLLAAVSKRGAWCDWLLFFLHGVAEQSQDAISKVKQLQDLQAEWRDRLKQTRVSAVMLGIVDSLFEHSMLSANDVQERFEVSHPTAMKALKKLKKMGILEETTNKERNRIFEATAILHILE